MIQDNNFNWRRDRDTWLASRVGLSEMFLNMKIQSQSETRSKPFN